MHYVFPGAEHSRFAHSLGVLAIVDKMARQLVDIQVLNDEALRVARLAALLHDIGHLPLAHLGEEAYEAYIIDQAKLLEGAPAAPHLLNRLATSNRRMHLHEMIGTKMITDRPELRDVLGGTAGTISSILSHAGDQPLLESLISSGLDADRLDYLVRDSNASGVRYGLVDVNYLIRMLRVGKEAGQPMLGIDEKGLPAVEHFLLARLFHYAQVVHHKTVGAFEAVAKALFYRMIECGILPKVTPKAGELPTELDQLCTADRWDSFNDESFFEYARNFRAQQGLTALDAAIADCILRRQRPRILCEIRDRRPIETPPRPKQSYVEMKRWVEEHPDQIAALVGVPPEFVSYTEKKVRLEDVPAHLTYQAMLTSLRKGEDALLHEARDAIRLVDSNGNVTLAVGSPDSLIPLLADCERYTLRIYCLEGQYSQAITTNLDAARKHIKSRFEDAIVSNQLPQAI